MLNSKDIPDSIKNSYSCKQVIKRSKAWNERKLIAEYMESFKIANDDYFDSTSKHTETYNHYSIRKEIMRRMSPLIADRSQEFIFKDNKTMLLMLDEVLLEGTEDHFKEAQEILQEIVSRMK